MTPEEIVNGLIETFNSVSYRKKFYYKFVQTDHYILIEFGSSKEQCFIFKDYLKPHHDVEKKKQKLFEKFIVDIFERMHLLIEKNRFA